MTLQFGLLGGLYIGLSAEGELPVTRKNRLVLAALALAGRAGLGRAALAHLLWGSFAEEQAQASLRQSLSSVRKALGRLADAVIAEGEQIRLDRALTRIDVEDFSDLLASTRAEDRMRALALYKGDLLAGIPLREEALEEWISPLRERLRSRAIQTLVGLIEAQPDHAAGQRLAEQLLAIDPLNEAAHRRLMSIFAAQGRTSEAVRQFTVCRERLQQELGVPPSVETVRLYETLRTAPPVAPDRPRAQPPASTEPEPSPFWRQKPTVAVLPFESLTADTNCAYMARALTADTLAALARHRWLSVCGGTSLAEQGAFATITGGRPTTSAADYAVTADVRSRDQDLRITVRLADGRNGELIWSESYDRAAASAFEVPEEVVQMIAARIEPQIGERERQRVLWRKPSSPGAWDCYHLGIANFYRFAPDAHAEAHVSFERCIALDPSFAEARAWAAFCAIISMVYYHAEPTRRNLDDALATARRAVELDDRSAFCHFALARVHLARREYDQAFWCLESAIDLNPNMATAYCALGDTLAYQGRLDDALTQFAKAMHLSPRDPMRWAYSSYCALAYLFKGDLSSTIRWSDDATRFSHCLYWAYAHKAAALGLLGRDEEACRATSELLRRRPDFSLDFARRKLFFLERGEQVELYLRGLESAGVPKA